MKKKSKKNMKIILLTFATIMIIPILLLIVGPHIKMFGQINSDKILYKEGNIEEEYGLEKLYGNLKQLSVTLLDNQGRIISSTDLEKEIDYYYRFYNF